MFGLGMGEIAIILVLALLLLGPQRLPDAAKQLGKGLREFRKATEDLKNQFETELYAEKPAKPTLVTPPPGESVAPGAAAPGAVPVASAENVPGLDAALVEAPPSAGPGATAAPAAAATVAKVS